jgi:hypothetical protein
MLELFPLWFIFTIAYRTSIFNRWSTSNYAGKIIDEKQRALETQQEKFVQKEKLLNKKEKDVKKMELECNPVFGFPWSLSVPSYKGTNSSICYIRLLNHKFQHFCHIPSMYIIKTNATFFQDFEKDIDIYLVQEHWHICEKI